MNSSAKKNQGKIPTMEQWVEIQTRDGKTTTELFPSNEKLLKKGNEMDPAPELVYRRLNFPGGVPREYHWVTRDEVKRRYGGLAIQRMTFATWVKTVKLERRRTDGHIGMTGVENVPRPKERGECHCEPCTRQRERHERI